MAAPNVFTLEEANALVPRLRALVQAQMERRSEIEQHIQKLAGLLGRVPEKIELVEGEPADVREAKREVLARVDAYRAGWAELEEIGAVLKDPNLGLVDFYGRVDGQLVWLCWRYGEDSVAHYHSLHEGFAGRKPIAATVRRRHLN